MEMQALVPFDRHGKHIKRNERFDVENPSHVADLERSGIAVSIGESGQPKAPREKAAPQPQNKMAPAPANKAPPSSADGEAPPSSASPAAPVSPQTTVNPSVVGGRRRGRPKKGA